MVKLDRTITGSECCVWLDFREQCYTNKWQTFGHERLKYIFKRCESITRKAEGGSCSVGGSKIAGVARAFRSLSVLLLKMAIRDENR